MNTEIAKASTAITAAVTKNLSFEVGKAIIATFEPFYEQAVSLVADSKAIVVTDVSQEKEMKAARAARGALKDVRLANEKTRVKIKEESLSRTKAIDDAARITDRLCDEEERRLLEMEKFVERAEAERVRKLGADRNARLAEFGPVDPAIVPSLGVMAESAFVLLVQGAQLAHDKRVAEAAKAEADRLAAEKERADREAEMRAENERLRKEREAQEAAAAAERAKAAEELRAAQEKARIEREAAEAEARKEREARERLEREAKAKAEAEAKAKRAAELAAKRAAAAPDADKLRAFAESVRLLTFPRMSTPEAASSITALIVARDSFVAAIERTADKIGAPQ